ncbi:MAG: hypothetical protein K0S38_926 [Candidatus Paceibacter sp.]|jgi:uncharacterized membrane protein YidH (DUF202 family)|nr:hypothetical protein [Candidatus Paceibacter sp.]
MDKVKLKKLEAHLSNERTFLSYIRTASAVLVLAVAMLRFFEDKTVIYLGFAVLALGLAVFALGVYRFFQERNRIHAMDVS